jgi:hypothetical protein
MSKSKAEINQIVLDYSIKSCKIPDGWNPLIKEIVEVHIHALGISLGNLELVYLRTLQHYDELIREADNE